MHALLLFHKLHKIPRDFVPMKLSSSLTRAELDARWPYWKALDRRPEAMQAGEPKPKDWDSNKLGPCFDCLKEVVYGVAWAVVNTHVAKETWKKKKNFTFGNGRRILKMSDVEEAIYDYDPEAEGAMPLDEFRAFVHNCCYGIFGKRNTWAEKGEHDILYMLGFEYDGNKMCDGTMRKRQQRGGFVKAILVKKLDSMRKPILVAWERQFREKLMNRDNYKPKPVTEEEDVEPAKKKRKKPDLSHLREHLVSCTSQRDGFDGHYLMLEGHPKRRRTVSPTDAVSTPAPVPTQPARATPTIQTPAPTVETPPAVCPPQPDYKKLHEESEKKVRELSNKLAAASAAPAVAAASGQPPAAEPPAVVALPRDEPVKGAPKRKRRQAKQQQRRTRRSKPAGAALEGFPTMEEAAKELSESPLPVRAVAWFRNTAIATPHDLSAFLDFAGDPV